MKRIAFYGGSFDPVHRGHIAIANALLVQFGLDDFVFIPAFHAPHKLRSEPTSAYDRYAMLCIVTQAETKMAVSKMELEMPERPFSVETLSRVKADQPDEEIFFVMGADSWMDITKWCEWEQVLSLTNHIVVTRPEIEIDFKHVTQDVRDRIVDLRHRFDTNKQPIEDLKSVSHIYISDAVNINVSASEIRRKIRENDEAWRDDVPGDVANYIEKYQIYT